MERACSPVNRITAKHGRDAVQHSDGSAYLGAEAAAQRQRIGVWAVPGGIQRPWDWRHGTRGPGQAACPSAAPSAPAGAYSGRKLTCRQIGSYARAQELLKQGHTYLDRNGDGVACESLG
jgi:hypothetical protein